MAQKRIVVYENNEIHYLLEQKQVKNLNLRVHKDCKVYVSANPDVPAEKVDDFVVSKGPIFAQHKESFVRWRSMPLNPSSMSVERLSICWAEESA